MNPPLRHYEPVWNLIKQNLRCEISAHPARHRRIKKALRKEKDIDYGLKMECLERIPPMKAMMHTKSEGSKIIFTLTFEVLVTIDTV